MKKREILIQCGLFAAASCVAVGILFALIHFKIL